MNIEARRAYLKAIKKRYKNSSKKLKSQILNEFCSVCGHSRKHAIRLLSDKHSNIVPFKRRAVGAPPKYSVESKKRLIELWQLMSYPCSPNLKAALQETKRKRPKAKSTTTPSKFKSQIPLKLCKDDDKKAVGHFEADTVAHCGDSLAGQFAWTLTMTDLHLGWTENRASLSKSALEIRKGVKSIEAELPFMMMGFSSDNGTEFLNETLQDYLLKGRKSTVEVSRGRPYKKNDNAHVEQKNFTHVRNLFGYERFEGEELVDLMNEIYINYWSPLKNFYSPCLKLQKKERIGSKIKKKYDPPKTPYERLLESRQLTMKQESDLREKKSKLNPFTLQKKLNKKLKEFFRVLESNRLKERLVA